MTQRVNKKAKYTPKSCLKMINKQTNNQIYGTPIRTFEPVIGVGGVHIEDFSQYKEDLPYNLIRVVNNSNGYLNLYVDNTYLRVLANESIVLDNRDFSHLKIISEVAVASGEVVINVQKTAMTADTQARNNAIHDLNPVNKVLGVIGRFF